MPETPCETDISIRPLIAEVAPGPARPGLPCFDFSLCAPRPRPMAQGDRARSRSVRWPVSLKGEVTLQFAPIAISLYSHQIHLGWSNVST